MCGHPKWERMPGMELCQKHALHVWAQVNTDIEGGEVKPPKLPKKPKPQPGAGWIYYLKVGDQIKVGYASDLQQRMRSYPPNATLFAAHRGTLDDEKRIHASLAIHRAAGREWYHPTPEMQQALEVLLAQHPGAAWNAANAIKPPPMPVKRQEMRVKNRMRTDRPRVVR
jgi:hypothetical protein